MPPENQPPSTSETKPSGYEEIDSEVHAWAAHEHQRRQAWLAGPSEREKAIVKARLLARKAQLSDDSSFDASKVDEEVEFWAEAEQGRRKAWAEGPDPALERHGLSSERWRGKLDDARDDIFRAWSRSDYAARGLWRRLYNDFTKFYEEIVEEGRQSSSASPKRTPIRY